MPGHAEVEDLDPAFGRDDDVGGLQIAVDDTVAMRVIKSLRHLYGGVHRVGDRQRPTTQPGMQRFTLDELEHQDDLAVEIEHVVQRGDAGWVRAAAARASRISRWCPSASARLRRQQGLERHGRRSLGILRQPHFPHSAGTEPTDDVIRPERLPRGERGHQRRRENITPCEGVRRRRARRRRLSDACPVINRTLRWYVK